MNPRLDSQKIERLIALTERLTGTIRADIAALEQGRATGMRAIAPDMQQLTLLYNREAAGVDSAAAKAAPAPLREKLMAATGAFREALALHARILTRMKNASEGLIQAVARDVEKTRQAARPYARLPAAAPRASGAMLYNSVV
ncbi:MAG TPA: hypothetical protein VMH86_13705 [Rhizomicrobium sp.]|nr:hypothetical protein [Rhizomicrobium sp.]